MTRKFSPDQRAKERESAELEIGGLTFNPVRKSNRLSAQLQDIARRSAETRKEAQIGADEVLDDQAVAELDPAAVKAFNDFAYEQIQLQIRIASTSDPTDLDPTLVYPMADGTEDRSQEPLKPLDEDGRPNLDWLMGALDIADVMPTIAFLNGDDPEVVEARIREMLADANADDDAEPEEDPTQPEAPSTPQPMASEPESASSDASPSEPLLPDAMPPSAAMDEASLDTSGATT